ncbi:unnamed protein product [Porites evermanni]|uniref:Uncharacterized protein n=1 Tax=Porites evermanni TaxID=104178 RepID=A0ABN8Q1A8_9CNID|nr:unnamed protein product [Porites evermanni]
MLVLGLKDPFSKERLMEREQSLEKTLQAARIAETSKQHMKSIKEEGSKVEKVDVKDGDPYKALLSYRNTPLEEINLSPSQMLMGTRLRTSIPATGCIRIC